MTASLRAALLAAVAFAASAAIAHAGDLDDLLSAHDAATTLSDATAGDDLLSQAVEAAAQDETVGALLGAITEAVEE